MTTAKVRSPRLWVIAGATGTGKSRVSLDLAETLMERGVGAEIVNADAMQVYRGMDIGTAKLPPAERRGIVHHLLDVREPEEDSSVAWYQPLARAAITQVFDRGHDAILVGGSGLYISSVIFSFEFPPRDPALRARLEAECAERGIAPLIDELQKRDARVAASVDTNNPRRVIRALETVMLGGEAVTELPAQPEAWYEGTVVFGLHRERRALVGDLDERVTNMWRDGIVAEVQGLLPGLALGRTASRAIGYAQALAQLRGERTESQAIAETQALTRRYARRQVSWFKRVAGLTWLEVDAGTEDALRALRARID